MPPKIPPISLAQSYLRQASLDGTGAVVMLAYKDDAGKSVVNMVSNRDDKTTQAFLGQINKLDDKVVEVAARAIAAADNLAWAAASEAKQHNYKMVARVALEAARAEAPKTLNLIQA